MPNDWNVPNILVSLEIRPSMEYVSLHRIKGCTVHEAGNQSDHSLPVQSRCQGTCHQVVGIPNKPVSHGRYPKGCIQMHATSQYHRMVSKPQPSYWHLRHAYDDNHTVRVVLLNWLLPKSPRNQESSCKFPVLSLSTMQTRFYRAGQL